MDIESLLPGDFIFSRIDAAENGVTGYLHQGSFCELDNGDLLYVVGATKKLGDLPGDLGPKLAYMWRSNDGGRSWQPVETPYEGNAMAPKGGPSIIKNTSEGVILFGRMISKDNGYTWGSFESGGTDWKFSPPLPNVKSIKTIIQDTGESGFNQWGPCGSCRPEILDDGSLLTMPCASWLEEPPSSTKDTIWFLRSEDLGRTWQFRGSLKRPPTNEVLCEPTLVKLPDGRWLAFIRSYVTILEKPDGSLDYIGSRYYYLAISEDDCKTWGEPWPVYFGSERWNGAMPEMCLVGDYLYIVGSFSQFQPPDFSGWNKDWEIGTQRTPLLLCRVPLDQVNADRKGAYILEPDYIRPLGISLNLNTRLSGTYASMEMEVLNDGALGIICDTHTHNHEEGNVLFWRVDPDWVTRGPQHALWRGPIPLVTSDGHIRILHTQTTVKPTHFPTGQLPVEISCRIRPYHFDRAREIVQPIFTIWNSADLTVPGTAYPHAIFAGLEVQTVYPKNGNCSFAVNTGAGRITLDVTAYTHRDYDIRIVIHSRWEWSLYIDGQEIGRYPSVCPGTPASYTLAHESYPGRDIDVSFWDIAVKPQGPEIEPLEHPFLLERFTKAGVKGDSWQGDLKHITLKKNGSSYTATLKGKHWARWLRFGGVAITASKGQGRDSVSLYVNGEKAFSLFHDDAQVSYSWGEKTGLSTLSFPESAQTLAYGFAASALHHRGYLCSRDSFRYDASSTFLPIADAEEITINIDESVEHCRIMAWDCAPASLVRLLQSR